MAPKLPFRDKVTFYETTKNAYGADNLDHATNLSEILGLLVQVTGFSHAGNRDAITSTSVLHLPADDRFLKGKNYRLEGLAVSVSPWGAEDIVQQFRIISVTPARQSLFSGKVTHIECQLQKLAGVKNAS